MFGQAPLLELIVILIGRTLLAAEEAKDTLEKGKLRLIFRSLFFFAGDY